MKMEMKLPKMKMPRISGDSKHMRLVFISAVSLAFLLLISFTSSPEDSISGSHSGSGRRLLGVEEDLGEKIGNAMHKFPHFSFTFVFLDGQFDPGNSHYQQSLGVFAVPFMIVAGVVFFGGLGYILFFTFCYIDKLAGYRYSGYERTWPRLLLIALSIGLALVCGAGIWANVAMHDGVRELGDNVLKAGSLLELRIHAVEVPLELLGDYINATDEFASFSDGLHTVVDDVNEYKPDVDKAELARSIIVFVLYGLVVAACVVGILAALFSWGRPSLLMAIVLWLTLSLMWVVCALHLSGSVATADGCETSDTFLKYHWFNAYSDNETYAYVDYFLHCPNSSATATSSSSSSGIQRSATKGMGDALKSYLTSHSSHGGAPTTQKMMKFAEVAEEGEEGFSAKAAAAASDSEVPFQGFIADTQELIIYANESLQEAEANNDTAEISRWRAVLSAATQLEDALYALLYTCPATKAIYDESMDELCGEFILGLTTIVGSQLIIGILGLILIAIGVIGWKRFPQPQDFRTDGSEILPIYEAKYSPSLEPINFGDDSRRPLLSDD